MTRIRFPIFFLAVLLAISPHVGADPAGPTVLVVPNRYTIVQLAFNMEQMRNARLIAYERVRKTGDLLMHLWDPVNRDWLKTDVKEYAAGTLISGPVARIMVVGAGNTFPEELVKASAWCEHVDSIKSLDIVTLVNTFNKQFAFTPREWRRLAKQYGLKLRDKNEGRRRYGRYGKPGEKRERPVPPRAKKPGDDLISPEDAVEMRPKPEVMEEKGVPVKVKEPEPVKGEPEKAAPAKTELEKTEKKKEEEPLPEDK